MTYATVNLGTIADWVAGGRLDAGRAITMQDLRNSGAVAKRVLWGVKLLAWVRRWAAACCAAQASPLQRPAAMQPPLH